MLQNCVEYEIWGNNWRSCGRKPHGFWIMEIKLFTSLFIFSISYMNQSNPKIKTLKITKKWFIKIYYMSLFIVFILWSCFLYWLIPVFETNTCSDLITEKLLTNKIAIYNLNLDLSNTLNLETIPFQFTLDWQQSLWSCKTYYWNKQKELDFYKERDEQPYESIKRKIGSFYFSKNW